MVDEAGQEVPGAGSGQIDQILESIIALASSFTLLQVQVDRKNWLPQQMMRYAALIRQAPTQACQAGTTGIRQQGAIKSPPASAPAIPTAPAQARGTPTFQSTPTLTPVQRTCNTMAGVSATDPDPGVPGLLVVFTLLEDRATQSPDCGLRG